MKFEKIRLFFDRSIKLTKPEVFGRNVTAAYMPFSGDAGIHKQCSKVLSRTELARADCFTTQLEKTRFVQRRAFQRYCAATALATEKPLSTLDFIQSQIGKPVLAGDATKSFSFSSCKSGMMAAWSGFGTVGIDVEDRTRNLQPVRLAKMFFSISEARTIEEIEINERKLTFLKFWCLKEAALKSIGKGLPFGLDKFQFSLTRGLQITSAPVEFGGPSRFLAGTVDIAPGCASIVLHKPA